MNKVKISIFILCLILSSTVFVGGSGRAQAKDKPQQVQLTEIEKMEIRALQAEIGRAEAIQRELARSHQELQKQIERNKAALKVLLDKVKVEKKGKK